MRIINSSSTKFNVALRRGLRAFRPWSWAPITVAVPLLLTAALWVMAPQSGQAQGTAPAQPTGLTATAGVAQAALTWDDPSDSSITGYEYLFHAQVAKLTAHDGAASDNYGHSVAVNGDTVVVGAYDDGPGSAHVYTRQSGAWNQVAKLTASDGANGYYFGYSVAVDGDTVVVGAYYDDSAQGAAYVFTKPAGGWATTSTAAKLTAFDGSASEYFGYSVAVDGGTVVVGAYGADGNANSSGAAYVFTKPATGWVTTSTAAKLTASDGSTGDYFGHSVAVDGDTAVVSAYDEGDNVADYGSAYVFTKPVAGWATTSTAAKLTASDGANNDYFGFSVAVDGDTVVVGAPEDDDGDDENSGSAYVFIKPNGGWADATETAKLTAFDGAAFDFFGRSVAVDGDTLVVSAIGDDDNGERSGSAYVFTKPTSGDWADATETAKLTASDGGRFDYLGLSVAVDGDTVVVGAPHEDESGSDAGSAYVYEVSDWTAIPDSAAGDTNATSYTVTGLNNSTEYTIAVRAVSANGNGPAATVTATVLWPAPTNLVAGEDRTRLVLRWDTGDPGITHYLISSEITEGSGDPPPDRLVSAGSGPRTQAGFTSLTNGTQYTFMVRAAAVSGSQTVVTGVAASVNATPRVVVPAAPTNLTATPGDGRVRVTWDHPGNITIRKYQYSTDGGDTFNHMNRSNQNTTSFTFKNLDNGEPYTFAIRASNLSGESAPAIVGVNQPTAVLVSNVSQSDDGSIQLHPVFNQAQSFTTGANTQGYSLESIEFDVHLVGDGTPTVTVRADNGSGRPGNTRYTLTNPANLGTGIQKFTASAGAHLNRNTKYWVHLSYAGGPNTAHFRWTHSNAEDTDALPGWSIGNNHYLRTLPSNNWSTQSSSIQIRVNTGPPPVYVSNDDQSSGGLPAPDVGSAGHAQGFTTGGRRVGFHLGRVELDLDRAPGSGTLTVTIRRRNASGDPGDVVHTLYNPTNVGTGLQKFMAPAGAYLGKNGNYFVHMTYSGGGTEPRWKLANGSNEDSGAHSGWSVADTHSVASDGNWTDATSPLKIRVVGLNVPPPPPSAPENLTATPGDGRVSVTWDHPGNITIRKYQYSTDGGTTFNHMNRSNQNTTSFTFKNLNNGTEYQLAIRASNLSGESAPAVVTATPSD